MRNLNDYVTGADLYIMKKRGIFKTTVVRSSPPSADSGAPRTIERTFSAMEIEEIEYRFAGLTPYLIDGR